MKKLYKWIADKAKWTTKNTPAPDKLAHAFWGDVLWSNIGYISAIVLTLILPSFWWILLPVLSNAVPALTKELSDDDGHGNKEWKDFFFTLTSLPVKLISLVIITYLKLNG